MSKTKQILYLAVALALFLSLAACAGGAQEEENTLLEYPGVSWEATPEEVIQAMGFPAGEVLTETVEDGYNLGMENWDCFGQEAQRIVFHFEADEAGRDRLHAIEITYPEDGDMDAVRQAMEAEYGPGVSTYTTSYVLRAEGTAGEGETYVAATEEVTGEDGHHYWLSPSVEEYCSPEALQAMDAANQPAEVQLTEEARSTYWSTHYPVLVACSSAGNRVWFDAAFLCYLRLYETG